MIRRAVLLIIPCYNEANSLGPLLNEIANLAADYTTFVVDDGSSDRTYEIASVADFRLRLLVNLGIGGAVQSGIKFALAHDFDLCLQIDGDGQHPPHQIAKLIEAQRSSGANIVIGSRYLHGATFRSTWARRLGSRIIGFALTALFETPSITDPTSGMRVMDRTAIDYFSRRYPQDFPEPISLAWALRFGLTVHETPIEMRPREHGQSSIFGVRSFAYMVRVLAYIVLARLRRLPTQVRP
jgi:glycosyltransferase involved in cell wall biosynthesis